MNARTTSRKSNQNATVKTSAPELIAPEVTAPAATVETEISAAAPVVSSLVPLCEQKTESEIAAENGEVVEAPKTKRYHVAFMPADEESEIDSEHASFTSAKKAMDALVAFSCKRVKGVSVLTASANETVLVREVKGLTADYAIVRIIDTKTHSAATAGRASSHGLQYEIRETIFGHGLIPDESNVISKHSVYKARANKKTGLHTDACHAIVAYLESRRTSTGWKVEGNKFLGYTLTDDTHTLRARIETVDTSGAPVASAQKCMDTRKRRVQKRAIARKLNPSPTALLKANTKTLVANMNTAYAAFVATPNGITYSTLTSALVEYEKFVEGRAASESEMNAQVSNAQEAPAAGAPVVELPIAA